VRALILTPTRELAVQVEESFRTYGKYTNLRSTVVYGGVDIKQQLAIVRGGVEILVATPGRLLDHIEHKSVYLGQVEIFVLDEADRMLDMGFIPDIKRIMALLPATAKRQNLLFSATFSAEIKRLADQLLNEPQLIEVAKRNTAAETVAQSAYRVPNDAKRGLLEHLVRSRNLNQVLCFMRTKHGASRLARQLEKDGLVTSAIHGDKSQQARLEALDAFKEGKLQVLVATDVAARGLDIDDLPLVVNYELPYVPEDYIHRIGRTGRAGASGEAISFVAPDEERLLDEIERLLKKKVPIATAEGFDPAAVRPERGTRASHGERAERPARAPRPPRAPAGGERAARPEGAERPTAAPPSPERTERTEREDGRSYGDIRREERERAYALNPDQPLPQSAPAAVRPPAKARPVPALLMRRPVTSEPEQV
jgi:ATP-dependent RNA helicase RhlE